MEERVFEVANSLLELLRSIELNPSPNTFFDQISDWMNENNPKMKGEEFRSVVFVTVQMCAELSRPDPINIVTFSSNYRSKLEGIISPQNLN